MSSYLVQGEDGNMYEIPSQGDGWQVVMGEDGNLYDIPIPSEKTSWKENVVRATAGGWADLAGGFSGVTNAMGGILGEVAEYAPHLLAGAEYGLGLPAKLMLDDTPSYQDILERTRNENIFGSLKDASEWMQREGRFAQKGYENLAQDIRSGMVYDDDDYLTRFYTSAASQAGKLLPAIAGYAATKNPQALGLGIRGTILPEAFGREYTKGEDSGMEPLGAASFAGAKLIPEYLETLALDPFMASGAIKGIIPQALSITGANVLDETVSDLLDQRFIEGRTMPELSLTDTFSRIGEGLPEMAGGMVGQVGGTRAGVRLVDGLSGAVTARQTMLIKQQEALDKIDYKQELDAIPEARSDFLDSQLTPTEPRISATDQAIAQGNKVIKVEGQVPNLKKLEAGDESITDSRKVVDAPEPTPDGPPVSPDEVIESFSRMLEEDTTVRLEKSTETPQIEPPKYAPDLEPFVQAKALTIEAAEWVTKGFPDSLLGENATVMRQELLRKAPNIDPIDAFMIGGDATNFAAMEGLKTPPVDLALKVNQYRDIVAQFEQRLSNPNNPFLAGMDTRAYKRGINDEVQASLKVWSDPDLVKMIDEIDDPKWLRRLAKERIKAKKEGRLEPHAPDKGESLLRGIADNEEGVLRIFEPIEKVIDKWGERKTNQDRLLAELESDPKYKNFPAGTITKSEISRIDKFLGGKSFLTDKLLPDGKINEAISQTHAFIRKNWTQRKKIFEKDERTLAIFNTKEAEWREAGVREHHAINTHGFGYKDLKDKERVVHPILLQRQKISEQAFRAGKKVEFGEAEYRKMAKALGHDITDAELRAIRDWDKSLEYQFDSLVYHWKDSLKKSITDPTELSNRMQMLDDWATAKKRTHYVPQARKKGIYALWGEHPVTGELYFNRFESAKDRAAVAKRLAAEGLGFNVKEYKWNPPTDAALSLLPDDLLLEMDSILGRDIDVKKSLLSEDDGTPVNVAEISENAKARGFKTHFLKREGVLGAPENLEDLWYDYHKSASRMQMRHKYRPKIASMLQSMERDTVAGNKKKASGSPSVQYTKDWLEYIESNAPEAQSVRAFIGQHTLGGHIPAAVLNATQTMTNTWGELTKVMKDAGSTEKALLAATKDYAAYVATPRRTAEDKANGVKPRGLEKSNPKLYNALEYARNVGELGDTAVQFKSGTEGRVDKTFETISEASMSLQRGTDHMNRGIAFIAAYQNSDKFTKSVASKDRVKTALEFVKRTNVDYSKLDRPIRATGKLSPTYSMELYGHNWYSNFFKLHRDLFGDTADVVKGKKGSGRELGRTVEALTKYYASTALLGGVRAIPLYPVFLQFAEQSGYDLEKDLLKKMDGMGIPDDYKLAVLFGPSALPDNPFAFSLGRALQPMQDLQAERTWRETAMAQALGMPYRMVELGERFYQSATDEYRGLSDPYTWGQLAPRAVKKPLEVWSHELNSAEGHFRNIKGEITLRNPSFTEKSLEALGFQGTGKLTEQMKDRSKYIAQQESTRRSEGFRRNLGLSAERFMAGEGNIQDMVDLTNRQMEAGMPPTTLKSALSNLMKTMIQQQNPMARRYYGLPTDMRQEQMEYDMYLDRLLGRDQE